MSCLPESSKNNSTDACINKLATSLSMNVMFKWKGFCFQVFEAYLEYVIRLIGTAHKEMEDKGFIYIYYSFCFLK